MSARRSARGLLTGAVTLPAVLGSWAPASAVTSAVAGRTGAVVGAGPVRVGRPGGVWATGDWDSSGGSKLADVAKVIGATSTKAAGLDGTGVGIALIDTGVAPVPGLPASHVVNGPDLSFESQAPNLRYLDTYGHGTHMAGIMIGNDPAAGLRGIAPAAKLTSIKVGVSSGAVDVSQVIAAINWVVAHRNDDPANPIRVINLSYGTDADEDDTNDPLLWAVENAWKAGIVVVCAGGNSGTTLDRLDNPGNDFYTINVGSIAGNGTLAQTDDTLSSFTSVSSTEWIDVAAPGESIVSLRDPGSNIDQTYPGARSGTALFRGSGSSQATAVVSAAAALLLQKKPTATPDQIKFWMKYTATPLKGPYADRTDGELNLAAALSTSPPTKTQTSHVSTGAGSLEDSRGSVHVVHNSKTLTGETDLFGPFSTGAWASATANGTAWKGGVWMGHRLAGDGWTGTSWASRTWAPATWANTDWAQQTWTDQTWTGRYWSGTGWSGSSWSGRYWSSSSWTGIGWTALRW
jgi:serine protease AprX